MSTKLSMKKFERPKFPKFKIKITKKRIFFEEFISVKTIVFGIDFLCSTETLHFYERNRLLCRIYLLNESIEVIIFVCLHLINKFFCEKKKKIALKWI